MTPFVVEQRRAAGKLLHVCLSGATLKLRVIGRPRSAAKDPTAAFWETWTWRPGEARQELDEDSVSLLFVSAAVQLSNDGSGSIESINREHARVPSAPQQVSPARPRRAAGNAVSAGPAGVRSTADAPAGANVPATRHVFGQQHRAAMSDHPGH